MNAFVAPAMQLMTRLRFPQKFLLIALLMLIPMVYILTTLHRNYSNSLTVVAQEQAGLQLARQLQEIIDQSQRHRGLTTSFLQGKQDFAPQITEAAGKLKAGMTAFEQLLAQHGEQVPVQARWQAVRSQLEQELAQWQGRTPAANFQAHTALISAELHFAGDIAQHSTLSLDPVSETYYLQDLYFNTLLPLTEVSGQARGAGSRIATAGQATPADQVQMHALASQMRFLANRVGENLARAASDGGPYAGQLKSDSDALMARVRQQAEQIDTLFGSGETVQIDPASYFATMSELIKLENAFTTRLAATIESALQPRAEALQRERILAFGLSILLFAIAAYGFAGTYYSLKHAVDQLNRESQAMAEGNLAARVTASGSDELASVGRSFNQMASALASVIGQIRQTSARVDHAAQALSGNASQVVSASQEQANASSSMAAAIEEITVSIANVADHAASSAEQARRAEREVEHGEQIMQQVLGEIRQLERNIEMLGSRIDTMQTHSNEIGRIVQAIRDIADQTNLLALNAAIEAARAGEQGRGFAVVADEVRKLAERTAIATQDISGLVGKISHDTAAAAQGMVDARTEMQRGSARVDEATQALSHIRESAGLERDAASEIDHAMAEQRQASQTVAQNVERIAGMASANTSNAEENARLAGEVRQSAQELVSLVDRFRVS
ncbi:methyl-accepting chemotaxis protein [Chitinilyticum litopenaei]|uniref:methyl-accepting chemotaxis protein n=1 Tax=Chitinilyticum litopenaei TaxID=1121276 RepID=UPI00041C16D1|nr:methyl-accepting chemotaxis protein [Chitinilyticum litopenaei]